MAASEKNVISVGRCDRSGSEAEEALSRGLWHRYLALLRQPGEPNGAHSPPRMDTPSTCAPLYHIQLYLFRRNINIARFHKLRAREPSSTNRIPEMGGERPRDTSSLYYVRGLRTAISDEAFFNEKRNGYLSSVLFFFRTPQAYLWTSGTNVSRSFLHPAVEWLRMIIISIPVSSRI